MSRDALRNERDAPTPEHDQPSAKPSERDARNGGSGDTAYVARISVAEAGVDTEQGPMPLEAGMTVTAEVKTGQRRVIDYLLSPFMRYRHEALKER